MLLTNNLIIAQFLAIIVLDVEFPYTLCSRDSLQSLLMTKQQLQCQIVEQVDR